MMIGIIMAYWMSTTMVLIVDILNRLGIIIHTGDNRTIKSNKNKHHGKYNLYSSWLGVCFLNAVLIMFLKDTWCLPTMWPIIGRIIMIKNMATM